MTTILDLAKIEQLKWRWGGPRDFWLANLEHIQKFLEKNKIARVDPAHLVMDDPFPVDAPIAVLVKDDPIPVDSQAVAARVYLKRPPFPGGLKCPHLHFKGDIFLLTESQWKDFSSSAIKQFQERLSRAKSVTFDQLMQLSEATADIG
jgi:hypothetical protein